MNNKQFAQPSMCLYLRIATANDVHIVVYVTDAHCVGSAGGFGGRTWCTLRVVCTCVENIESRISLCLFFFCLSFSQNHRFISAFSIFTQSDAAIRFCLNHSFRKPTETRNEMNRNELNRMRIAFATKWRSVTKNKNQTKNKLGNK